jgi:SNF2 family DNA or RNA helicase
MADLGGVLRTSDILSIQASVKHSGKMVVLDKLLMKFSLRMDKTLIFSQSTKVLSLIEELVRMRGWRYYRLDGQVSCMEGEGVSDLLPL